MDYQPNLHDIEVGDWVIGDIDANLWREGPKNSVWITVKAKVSIIHLPHDGLSHYYTVEASTDMLDTLFLPYNAYQMYPDTIVLWGKD